MVLALLVHGLLMLALTWGIRWQDQERSGVDARRHFFALRGCNRCFHTDLSDLGQHLRGVGLLPALLHHVQTAWRAIKASNFHIACFFASSHQGSFSVYRRLQAHSLPAYKRATRPLRYAPSGHQGRCVKARSASQRP
jgi:hypothetical protein